MAKAPAHAFALCKPCRITARPSSNKPVNLHSFLDGRVDGWRDFSNLHSVKNWCCEENLTVIHEKYKQDKTVLLQVASMLLIRPLGNIPGCPKRNIKGTWCKIVWFKKKKKIERQPPFLWTEVKGRSTSFPWFVSLWMNQTFAFLLCM